MSWDEDEDQQAVGDVGIGLLMRQTTSIAGGIVEMSRNVVRERFLGMPPAPRNDHDIALRDVPAARRT